MTESNDHPYVTNYLLRFDEAAKRIPEPRRLLLREEIAEHLRDSIPASSSDEAAAKAIAQFGSPAEILAHELDGSHSTTDALPRRRRWVGWVIAGLAAGVAAVLAVVVLLPALAALGGTVKSPSTAALPGNPVTQEPEGAALVTTGRAYFEYRHAIERMEHPLPDGAEYPLGVPEGLDSGQTSDGEGMMESRAGANIAHFTWLCAWESEYLLAVDAADDRRQVAAETMIASWAESDFSAAMGDTEGGWVTNVVAPMRINDPSGVKQDRIHACAAAGINVRSR
jgi:hypothetical protein